MTDPFSNTHSIAQLAQAAAKVKSAVALALAGEDDPSERPEILEQVEVLDGSEIPGFQEKLQAFCKAMRDPDSVAGINRKVVLARGQRFLLTLMMALEDAEPEERKPARKGKSKVTPIPQTPFDEALLELKGVGPKTAARLASRGLTSPVDVLFWLPRRYDDRRTLTPIADLSKGQRIVTSGEVEKVRVYGRPWKRIMEVVLKDGDHTLSAMWFSNRRPSTDKFIRGTKIKLAGLVSNYKNRLQIAHPVVVSDDDESDRFGRVVPVYAEVPGVPGRTVEKAIASAVARSEDFVEDPTPKELLKRRSLMPLRQALELVHLPPGDVKPEDLDAWIEGNSPAHRRLAYDEFFYIQLALTLRRKQMDRIPAPLVKFDVGLDRAAAKLLGFEPTLAQSRVIGEILHDMSTETPMRRLLQGDVGSGKTLVALAAILAVVRSGKQAALMAPTEILAEQHMRTLEPVLSKLGIRAVLHLGQARSSTRKKTVKALETGTADLAIGTHALIQGQVEFARLGLAVVDEQHRFGVAQRLGLVGKGAEGKSPHLLVMTATPIPRTLALTVHGDLDISVLDELPPGRTPISTQCWSEDERPRALERLSAAIDRGEQAYVVCPIIEESEKLDVSAAEAVYEQMCERYGENKVSLLHGRLSGEDRDKAMDSFISGEKPLLVTTTVIEVGVDVPRATIMMIEGAERFGLAQLHQLRGRVGRSNLSSECHLVGNPKSDEAVSRLEVLTRTTDGFEIAEADLAIRGPGELYGRRQAGLPGFRFGNLARDGSLLLDARDDVKEILNRDPTLRSNVSKRLKNELTRRILSGDGPVGEESG